MKYEPLIDRLGGSKAVAEALKQKQSTISMWRVRGVPWRFRPAVVALAKRRGVSVPRNFLDPGCP